MEMITMPDLFVFKVELILALIVDTVVKKLIIIAVVNG
jgi:hypothetical protein